jgi:type II secretory pathway pseudopilin PulG
MKSYKRSVKGFTLIDLLLSTAIISLLSSVFLFQVTEAKRKAEDSHMKAEAQQVSSAIALYKNENGGSVPMSVRAVPQVVYTETDIEYQESMQLLVDSGHLSEIPKSSDGQSYSYAVDQNNNAFFAFKLRQGAVSSNTKNACSVSVQNSGGTKTFNSCVVNNSCVESSGVQCFNNAITHYSNYCYCNGSTPTSNNPSVFPSQICPQIGSCGTFTMWILSPPRYACTYTLSNTSNVPACDGSSNADYCECM